MGKYDEGTASSKKRGGLKIEWNEVSILKVSFCLSSVLCRVHEKHLNDFQAWGKEISYLEEMFSYFPHSHLRLAPLEFNRAVRHREQQKKTLIYSDAVLLSIESFKWCWSEEKRVKWKETWQPAASASIGEWREEWVVKKIIDNL